MVVSDDVHLGTIHAIFAIKEKRYVLLDSLDRNFSNRVTPVTNGGDQIKYPVNTRVYMNIPFGAHCIANKEISARWARYSGTVFIVGFASGVPSGGVMDFCSLVR
jgi:hypothetical protein